MAANRELSSTSIIFLNLLWGKKHNKDLSEIEFVNPKTDLDTMISEVGPFVELSLGALRELNTEKLQEFLSIQIPQLERVLEYLMEQIKKLNDPLLKRNTESMATKITDELKKFKTKVEGLNNEVAKISKQSLEELVAPTSLSANTVPKLIDKAANTRKQTDDLPLLYQGMVTNLVSLKEQVKPALTNQADQLKLSTDFETMMPRI